MLDCPGRLFTVLPRHCAERARHRINAVLSYRHAFHAGNHADVLKHLVLVHALDYLAAKDAPLWYIDTHAGAGRYELGRGTARGHTEYQDGIGALWEAKHLPPALARYREVVAMSNPGGRLQRYPGSPSIARMLLRPQDRMWLHELHPADALELERDSRKSPVPARVIDSDGFAGLRALLPPQPRRAIAMIDPSYELDSDYRQVVEALRDAVQRFASGVYLLWYPLLASRESRRLPERLEALGAAKWLHARLELRPVQAAGSGLCGSGMFVINPPWTLREALEECRELLPALLAPGGGARLEIDSGSA
jgi:23S rRNA (adenine2030-N6)-methyltransferase